MFGGVVLFVFGVYVGECCGEFFGVVYYVGYGEFGCGEVGEYVVYWLVECDVL